MPDVRRTEKSRPPRRLEYTTKSIKEQRAAQKKQPEISKDLSQVLKKMSVGVHMREPAT
jgi:hypothetical protein